MKNESLHPEIKRLLELVGEILPLTGIGTGATDSFWKERSLDCHFLEFGEQFSHEQEPRVRVQFYPGQAESVSGIDYVEILTPEEIMRVNRFMRGELHLTERQWPRLEQHWAVRNCKDTKGTKAPLVWLEITAKEGGSVSYASFYPESDEWSHGTTSGYSWTSETPKTLKTKGGILGNVWGKIIVPETSVKDFIDRVISLGKFEEFKAQLLKREPRFVRKAA